MNPEHSALLNKCNFRLVREMHPEDVIDYLLSEDIFNHHHVTEIKKKSDDKERNRELLSRLKERGPSAFDKFVEALNATDQSELAKLLSVSGAPSSAAASVDDPVLEKLRKLNFAQYKDALTKSLQFICDNLKISEVLVIMEKEGAIRKVPLAEIMAGKTFYDHNRSLVDHIQRSGQEAFNAFVKALLETGQKDIANEIAKNAKF